MKQIIAIIFLGLAISQADAQQLDTTVLGAIADTPPIYLTVDGTEVVVFEAARNELASASGLHSAGYFYAAKPRVATNESGSPLVIINESVIDPSIVVAHIEIEHADVNKSALLNALKERVDAYITEERIRPLMVYGVDVSIQSLPKQSFVYENAERVDNPLSPAWELTQEQATRLQLALSNKTPIRFGYITLVKLSNVNVLQLDWSAVVNTSAFLDYSGPSSPSFISASQASDFAHSVLSELNVLDWREGGQVGYGDQAIEEMSKAILDRFLAGTDKKEIDIRRFIEDNNRGLPLAEWQKMIDVTTSIALDAKQLDDYEWCRKYKTQLKDMAEQEGSGTRSRNFGFAIPVPKLGRLGFNYGRSGSSSSRTLRTSESVSESSDCGRKQVEDSFTYDWNGTTHVPKSIYAFERNQQAGNVVDRQMFQRHATTQRIGRNEWRLP